MNTPQRKFFLCIWHWQCPKISPGNLNSIKKSKGCMNGVTSRVGKRWQNVYKLIMKSTRTFQEFWSYPLRFCSPPRWRDVYSPPYGRQGIDIVKITDLVVSCKTSPHTSVHDCVGYLAGSLHDPLRWDCNLHFVSDVGAALLQDQQEQGRPHQRLEWPSPVIISCKYFSSTALCTSVEICINK